MENRRLPLAKICRYANRGLAVNQNTRQHGLYEVLTPDRIFFPCLDGLVESNFRNVALGDPGNPLCDLAGGVALTRFRVVSSVGERLKCHSGKGKEEKVLSLRPAQECSQAPAQCSAPDKSDPPRTEKAHRFPTEPR